ncbi:MAG: hypothetical protein Q9188_007422, partial [Gyalolechia gomerana]
MPSQPTRAEGVSEIVNNAYSPVARPPSPASSVDEDTFIENFEEGTQTDDLPDGQQASEPLPHDSQDSLRTEPPLDYSSQESGDSWKTVSTLPLPSGERARFELRVLQPHQDWAPCQTGCLVRDDSRFSMDDVLTQQAVIPPTDPNGRKGNGAVNEQDRSDILCVLSPASPSAYEAVELVALTAPQHVVSEWCPAPMTVDNREKIGAKKPSLDIALRMSSRLLNPCRGFNFGRNPKRCDLLICTAERDVLVSGTHFRIYITAGGVLMCQDTSSNGTFVDSHALRHTQRTLHDGSTIDLMYVAGASMRFYVRVPDREGVSDVYGRKLEAYIGFVEQHGRQKQEEFNRKTKGLPVEIPPVPTLPFNHGLLDRKRSTNANKNLVAGTEPYQHGMKWNGGTDYKVTGHIGRGAFASVYKLARRHDGELFAVKEIAKMALVKKGVVDRRVEQELAIMKRLEHPNIVQYIGHHETKDHLYIIMELVQHGDLQSYLNNGQPRFQEHFCQAVATQMCEALKYLHDSRVTHRDIKPDNILICSNDPYIFKLSDFGLSKVVNTDETFLKSFCGTLLYCAPEVYPGYDGIRRHSRKRLRASDGSFVKNEAKQPYTSAVDIWGLAAVLYHLLSGSPPFEGTGLNHGAEMLHKIMNTTVDYDKLRLGGVSDDAIDFLKRILVTDPASRLTDSQCLDHPWITRKARPEASTQDLQAWTQAPFEDHATRDTKRADEADLNAFASQLSIADRDGSRLDNDGDEELPSEDLDEIQEMGQSKRKRQGEGDCDEEPSLDKYNDDLTTSDSLRLHPAAQQQPRRLFGEVTHSALQSSGALDWQANAALEVGNPGHRNPALSESHYAGESQFSAADYPNVQEQPAIITYPSLRTDDPSGAAPSLLGAEAMVGQLNMDSVMADAPPSDTDGQPATPTAERFREKTPQSPAEGHQFTTSSQGLYSATPPRSAHHPQEPTASSHQHNSPSARHKKHGTAVAHSPTTRRTSTHPDQSKDDPSTPAALLSDAPIIGTTAPTSADPSENKQQPPRPTMQLQPAVTTSSSTTKKPGSTAVPTPTTIAPPPPNLPQLITPLGTLTTLPSSVPYPKIYLTDRITSFGRTAKDYPWPDATDIRVPKIAFKIFFYRPNLDFDLDTNPNTNWRADSTQLQACISTHTSQFIWINGVRLTRGKDNLYGLLRTGDVITVFQPSAG